MSDYRIMYQELRSQVLGQNKKDHNGLCILMVRVKGLEPPCRKTLDPKSSASANFATLAH